MLGNDFNEDGLTARRADGDRGGSRPGKRAKGYGARGGISFGQRLDGEERLLVGMHLP